MTLIRERKCFCNLKYVILISLFNSFFNCGTHKQDVSGGPFGIEPSIRAGGNFYAILGKQLLVTIMKLDGQCAETFL